MKRFTLGVLQKSSSIHFNRIFPLFIRSEKTLISLGGAHSFHRRRAISIRCSSEKRFFVRRVQKRCFRSRGVSKNAFEANSSSFSLIYVRPKCAYFPRRGSFFPFFRTRLERECVFYGFGARAGSGGLERHFFRFLKDLKVLEPFLYELSDFLR